MGALILIVGVGLVSLGVFVFRDPWRLASTCSGLAIIATLLLSQAQLPDQIIGQGSEWFWVMAQFLAISATLIFIVRQLHTQRLGNILNLLSTFNHRWESNRLLESRKAICSADSGGSKKLGNIEGGLCDFFEELALYLKLKAVDDATVWELFSHQIEHYWPIMGPVIAEARAENQDETLYSGFEELYHRMQKYSRRRGLKAMDKSAQQLENFKRDELEHCKQETRKNDFIGP